MPFGNGSTSIHSEQDSTGFLYLVFFSSRCPFSIKRRETTYNVNEIEILRKKTEEIERFVSFCRVVFLFLSCRSGDAERCREMLGDAGRCREKLHSQTSKQSAAEPTAHKTASAISEVFLFFFFSFLKKMLLFFFIISPLVVGTRFDVRVVPEMVFFLKMEWISRKLDHQQRSRSSRGRKLGSRAVVRPKSRVKGRHGSMPLFGRAKSRV